MSYAVASTAPTNTTTQSNLPAGGVLMKLALASGLISGGVVGHDYARWIDVNPMGGAVAGFMVGAVLAAFLSYIAKDPEQKLQSLCSTIGALAGLIFGAGIGAMNDGGVQGLGIGAVVGTVIGAIAGRLVAMFISLSAFLLLFVSRGPVGLYLRNVILDGNETTHASALDALAIPQPSELIDGSVAVLATAFVG